MNAAKANSKNPRWLRDAHREIVMMEDHKSKKFMAPLKKLTNARLLAKAAALDWKARVMQDAAYQMRCVVNARFA
jgi:hypothetical protein